MIVIRFLKPFDCAEDVNEELKLEIKLIIKSNEFLAENKIKNEIVEI